MTIPISHLSATSLSMFRECPMQFYGRYIQKWPTVYPPLMRQAAQLGTAVHAAIEAHHCGEDPIRTLCDRWGSIRMPMMPNAFLHALRIVRLYTSAEAPDSRDIIERKFTLEVPGVDLPIIGYIDVQRGLVAKELKTTSSATWWTPERAATSLQTTLYSMAVSREHHGAQATVEHHILSYNAGKYSHTVYANSLNKSALLDREEEIRETWKEIQKGELNAVCKPGKCRYPEYCRDYGYVGTDTAEFVLDER